LAGHFAVIVFSKRHSAWNRFVGSGKRCATDPKSLNANESKNQKLI